jgi:UDP-glucuronate 4-epimerase
MAAGEPIPVYGDGSTERDYTYVDDAVAGVEQAVEHLAEHEEVFEIVNIGESRTVSLSEMIRVVAEELGVEPVVDRQPLQPGDVPRTSADVTRARQLLGYDPRTPFREGVRRFVEWFREERRAAGDG